MEAEEIEEVSIWDALDDQTICNIISRVTNFQDLLNYVNASERIQAIALTCVESLDSEPRSGISSADSFIEVDLDLLAGYRSLQSVGDNILLMVNPDILNIFSTLPSLRKANIYITEEFTSPEIYIFSILDQLDILAKTAEGGRASLGPQVNFRIGDPRSTLFVQGNQFMFLGRHSRNQNLIAAVKQRYPQLLYFDSSILGPGLEEYRLISRTMRDFLREGDFGLVNPTQPPSANNPPLALYLSRLADSRMSSISLLRNILTIYVRYNGLVIGGRTIQMDDLMKKYFRGVLERLNQRRVLEGRPPVPVDAVGIANLVLIPQMTTASNNPKYTENILELDIPILLDPQDEAAIEQAVNNALLVYRQQRVGQSLQVYATDGTQRTI